MSMHNDFVIDFIFNVPQTFSFVMALMLALSKIVRILSLGTNFFQELSEIFQPRKAQIS